MYRGVVTRVAVKGSLPLCEAMGHKFFLGPGTNAQFCGEQHCIAWDVKDIKVTSRPKASDPMAPLIANSVETHIFNFAYSIGTQQHIIKPAVTLWALVPSPDFQPTKEEQQLGFVRLSKVSISAQSKSSAPKSKSNGKGKVRVLDPKFEHCRHLLR